jgi:FkbM family methyltransferase
MTELPIAAPYQFARTRYGTMLVNVNDIYMGQSILQYGECCQHEIDILLPLLKIPGTVIEVGANMGVHTVPLATELARLGRSMFVFEPQPVIFQQLCANLAINGLMNVTALPYACGSEHGTVSFTAPDYCSPGNFGGTSMSASAATPSVRTAPCHTLDSLIQDAPVSLIKIDVEGYELQVLQGASNILAHSHPVLYVENDRAEHSAQLIQWLMNQGYRLWWHITPAYNPHNFLGVHENTYGPVCFFNMLCIHQSRNCSLQGFTEITDPTFHPLASKTVKHQAL